MSFAEPMLVWMAGLTAALVVLVHWLDLRRQHTLMRRLGELPTVQRMMAARSPWRRRVKAILQALGLGLVVLAAARPQVVGKSVTKRKGMDLVVAIDVSKSMLVGDVEVAQPPGGWSVGLDPDAPRPVPDPAEWVQGTRLERARQMLTELVKKLPDDRISVVLFAGASIHFPLTDDEHLVAQLAHLVGPTDLTGGSDVGEALRVGRCLLRPELDDPSSGCYGVTRRGEGGAPLDTAGERRKRKPKVEEVESEERGKAILVITDGGAEHATVAAEADEAKRAGISLFFVGVGTEGGGVVPELDWEGNVAGAKKDAQGNAIRSTLDRAGLAALAELGGGASRYVELPPKGAFDVAPVVEALGGVQRGALERIEHETPRDVYHVFLFPGLLLLVIEAAIGLRRRLKYPEAAP